MIHPDFYKDSDAVIALARKKDAAWFRDRPGATFRVRPAIDGESPPLDAFLAAIRGKGVRGIRGYVIVINHGRLMDTKKAEGIVVYPVGGDPKVFTKERLADNARRLIEWHCVTSARHPAGGNSLEGATGLGGGAL